MTNSASIIEFCLSFDEVVEAPHFEKKAFKVNKKIFATLDSKNLKLSLKLTEIDQSVFSDFNPSKIQPANKHWGKHGWTIFEFEDLNFGLIKDALTLSYSSVAPKRLAEKYKL